MDSEDELTIASAVVAHRYFLNSSINVNTSSSLHSDAVMTTKWQTKFINEM